MRPTLVCFLLVLCFEPTFAEVNSAVETTMCSRNSSLDKVITMLPKSLQLPLQNMLSENRLALQSLFAKVGSNLSENMGVIAKIQEFINRFKGQAPDTKNTVSFLELEGSTASDCVVLGVLATLCTIVSTLAIYSLFYTSNYFHKVVGNGNEVSLEDFGELAENIYGKANDIGSGDAKNKWALPPSGFSAEELKLYKKYLSGEGTQVPKGLQSKFAKRKELEKHAYEEFLTETMYVKTPKDKSYLLKVILPSALYIILHIATYVTAYELGKH